MKLHSTIQVKIKTVEIRNVTSSEQVMKRAFQIIKVSSDGEAGSTPVLKGAHFVVKLESEVQKVGWDNAKSYDELVTDDKGYAKSIELPYGKYRVKETVVPADHSPVADFFVNITNDSREPLKWTVQNDMPYKTYIGIVKTDAETGDVVRLSGATFKIKNLDTNEYVGFWVYGNPTVKWVDEFVTDDDGNLITPGSVRAGHYRIEEIKAPNGMLLNRESLPFTLTEDDAQQIGPDGSSYITTFQFSNRPAKGMLIVEKTAELFTGFEEIETDYGKMYKAKFENGLLAGVTYEIRAREDIKSADGTRIYYHKGQLVETLKTDGANSTKSSLLPLGKYTLQETNCEDDGYVIDSNVYDFDLVYKDQTTEVVFQTMKPINDKQRARASLDKQLEDSEVIDNTSTHGNIKFGVFTDSELTVNGNNVLDKDKLIQVVSLNDTLKGSIKLDFASNYYLKEIATDDQYVLNGEKIPFNFAYAGNKETIIEINGGNPIENKVKRGEIKILKTDADSGNPVAGAVFELSRDKDFENVFMTLTSGADGYAIAEGVEKSTIYVREKTAPDGYAGNKKIEKVEIVENGQIINLSYSNEAYHGYITLHKTEKETNDDLSGIVYKVIANEDIYAIGHPRDADGNKIIAYHKGDTVTTANAVDGCYITDETGSIFIGGETGLPMGKYAIFEVQTLETHVLDPLKHIVTISPDSDTKGIIMREVNAENDFIKIKVSKLDSLSKDYVVGAKLQLINKSTGKVAYEWISRETGERFDRVAAGTYILHEIAIPSNSGYVTAKDIEITVESRTDIQDYVLEDDHTKFDISKTDITTGKEIIGATLQILDEKGKVVEEWITTGTPHRVEYLHTNKTYTLHEEYVADGYVHAEDIKFIVKDTGEIQKVNMKDDYTKFDISKTDVTTGEEIKGATLQLLDKEGNVVDEWVSDGTPHRIEYLPIDTEYTLHEEFVADGYVHAEDIKFTVKDTGEIQKVNMKDDYTKFDISKTDITTGEEIKGATLQLLDKDGNVVDEWVSDGTPYRIEYLPIDTEYTLHEEIVADGYVYAEDIKFTVKDTGEIQKVNMKDDYTKVQIIKRDKETGDVLLGAEMQLFYSVPTDQPSKDLNAKRFNINPLTSSIPMLDLIGSKELVAEWKSEETPHEINRLKAGTYILHEKTAPHGYERAEDIEFEVKETGEVQLITMEDVKIYSYINVKKVDAKDNEKVLKDAEFTLYADEDCTKELSKAYTNEDGIAKFDKISYQTVYIKETKAPAGYNLSDDVAKVIINDEWVKSDNKTITFADHIIEPITPVDTGMQSNKYLVGLFLSSLAVIPFALKRRKSKK